MSHASLRADLRRLEQFVAVAEELHFGRAARRLGMTQPPLSIQIRRLEEQVGTPLLARTRRRVALTDAGAVLLGEARALLERAEHALRLAAAAGRGETGELRIGFVSTADYSVLPEVLRRFRERYPGVRVCLRELTTDAQQAGFVRGELDLGFVVPPLGDEAVHCEPLLAEPLIAALPADHALARGRRAISAAALAGADFVLFPRESAPRHHDAVLAYCHQAGFTPRVAQVAVQMQTIVSLVSAGLGVAFVPACLRALGRAGVVYRALRPATPVFHTALAWRSGHDSMARERFVAVAREVAAPGRSHEWLRTSR